MYITCGFILGSHVWVLNKHVLVVVVLCHCNARWNYVFYWISVLVIVSGMMLINTAANDARLGRSFHIAQSFAADTKKVSNSIGRPYRETFPQPTELTRHVGEHVASISFLEGAVS